MKSHENNQSEAVELRQKAEAELKTRKPAKLNNEIDFLKLIHELQVHQIELEMQNEELTKAREHAEETMEKYTDLYDFAPSGYITLSGKGEIIDLNFSAASMLGNNRIHLKNTRFGLYILHESLKLFNDFFNEIQQTKGKKSCELSLQLKAEKPCYIHIDAMTFQDKNNCLLSMLDITERKAMEIELKKSLQHQKELNSYFLDRELRMMDLKKEINELLIKSGCEQEYLI